MRLLSVIAIAIVFAACSSSPRPEFKTGIWRGVVEIQGKQLPFNFEVAKDSTGKLNVFIKNGSEKILLDEVSLAADTVTMVLHIFDAELRAKIEGDSLKGFFIKNYEKNYKLPFKASFGQNFRFERTDQMDAPDFSGKYAVKFISKDNTISSVGIFLQDQNHVEGTFLTSSGDYRYLEGSIVNGKMYLSTFDGNHAFLFEAQKTSDTTLEGEYWSGKTLHKSWTAIKDENAALPDTETLTYLNDGYDKIEFSFPDVNGNVISPADEKYRNKVVILQLFGTWCPNCMDETNFLKEWYKNNKNRGVEIIGLAYERKDDFTYASSRVKKMKAKLSVDYDFVIAGTNDNAKASATLPMLNKVVAFPTTIFIGRDGNVKKIHTGFSGPGTGIYYEEFIQHFNETVNELLAEDLTSRK